MAFAVNPTAPTYPTRSLYVAPWEFLNAPTGVDTNQLVPGGSASANQAALVMQLQRASTLADNLCQKVLAATVDTQYGKYRVQSDPWSGPVVKVPLDFTPVVAISAVSAGWTPGALTALSDLSGVSIGKKAAVIPLYPGGNSTGPLTSSLSGGSHAYVSVQYVNGWANTSLTAAPSGASLAVASDLGIVPGQQLRLANATASETVTVAPGYTPAATGNPTAVPLTAAPVGTYTTGDLVTAMPQDIKQAVILLAKDLIKTRASQSIEFGHIGGDAPGAQHGMPAGVTSDYELALEILAPYRRAI